MYAKCMILLQLLAAAVASTQVQPRNQDEANEVITSIARENYDQYGNPRAELNLSLWFELRETVPLWVYNRVMELDELVEPSEGFGTLDLDELIGSTSRTRVYKLNDKWAIKYSVYCFGGEAYDPIEPLLTETYFAELLQDDPLLTNRILYFSKRAYFPFVRKNILNLLQNGKIEHPIACNNVQSRPVVRYAIFELVGKNLNGTWRHLVKVFPEEFDRNSEGRKGAIRKLLHPGTILPFLVGGSSRASVDLHPPFNKNYHMLPFAVRTGIKVVDLLRKLHERDLIHGDVHPGNFAFSSSNELLVIDFGRTSIIEQAVAEWDPSYQVFLPQFRTIDCHAWNSYWEVFEVQPSFRDDMDRALLVIASMIYGPAYANSLNALCSDKSRVVNSKAEYLSIKRYANPFD